MHIWKAAREAERQQGFTLIEIIAVLVLMGILAAVALPKFMDLQAKARSQAVRAAVAELTARVNQHFADQVLEGHTYSGIGYSRTSVDVDLGPDFLVRNWDDSPTDVITLDVIYPANQTVNLAYAITILKPLRF